MAVRVRMFAALRDAAGEAETTARPAPVAELLAELADRYGEPFRSRLQLASVLLDGTQVAHAAPTPVPDGAELVLLPPVSGGAPSPRPRGLHSRPVTREAER